MSDQIELTAEKRVDLGKGASRRLRRQADLVPAVMYGAGKEAVSLTIPHKDLYKACENEAFYSQILSLKTEAGSDQVILKDLQRHPAKKRILHADFFRVRMDQKLIVEIPLHFVNEERCLGVRLNGGILTHTMTGIEISCLPGDLPEFLEVNVEDLDIGDAIHISQVALPEGVEVPALQLGDDHDQVVVTVQMLRAAEEESVVEEAADDADTDADESETDESDED